MNDFGAAAFYISILSSITLVISIAVPPKDFTVLRQLSQPDVFTNPQCNSTQCLDNAAVPFRDCECQCREDMSTFDITLMRCSRNVSDGQNVWFGSSQQNGVTAVLLPFKGQVVFPMTQLFTNKNGSQMEPLSSYHPCVISSVMRQSLSGWVPCLDAEAGFYLSLEKSRVLLKWNDTIDSAKDSIMGKLMRMTLTCRGLTGDAYLMFKIVGSLKVISQVVVGLGNDVQGLSPATNNTNSSLPLTPLPKQDTNDNLVLIVSLSVTAAVIVIAIAVVLIARFVMQLRVISQHERSKNFEGFVTPQSMTNPLPDDAMPEGPVPVSQPYDGEPSVNQKQPSPPPEKVKSTSTSPKRLTLKGLGSKKLKRQSSVPPGDDSYDKNWLKVKQACQKTISLPPSAVEYWKANPYIADEPQSHNHAMRTIRGLILRAKDKVRGLSSLTPIFEEEEAHNSAITGSNLSIDSILFSMTPRGSVSSDTKGKGNVGGFLNNSFTEEEMYYQVPEDSFEPDWGTLDEYLEENLDGVEFGDAILGYNVNPSVVPVTNIDDVSSDTDEGISRSFSSSKSGYIFETEQDHDLGLDVLDGQGPVLLKQSKLTEDDPVYYYHNENDSNVRNSGGINLGDIAQESSSDQSDSDTRPGPAPPPPTTPPPVLLSSQTPTTPTGSSALSHSLPFPPTPPVLTHLISAPPPAAMTLSHSPPLPPTPPVLYSQIHTQPPAPMTLSHIPITPPMPVLQGNLLPPPVSITGKHIPPIAKQTLPHQDHRNPETGAVATQAIPQPPPPPPLPPNASPTRTQTNTSMSKPLKRMAPAPPAPMPTPMPSDRSDSGMHSDSSSLSSDSAFASSTRSDGQASIKTNKSETGIGEPKPDYDGKSSQTPSPAYKHSIEMTGDVLTVTRQPKKMVSRNLQDRESVKFWDEMGYPCPNNDKERTISLQKERKRNRQKMYFNTPHKKQMSSAYNRSRAGLVRNASQTKATEHTWTNSIGRGRSLPGKTSSPLDKNLCLKTDNLSLLRIGGIWEV